MTRLMLVILMAFPSSLVCAQGLDRARSILDRLEQSLVDQTSPTKSLPKKETKDEAPVESFNFAPAQIEGTNEAIDFASTEQLIQTLERQIEKLAASVEKSKQQMLDKAKTDNFVTLEAALSHSDKAAIKQIDVSLDGYKVYEINDAAGLWMPSKNVPLYAGPLQPGAHRIDMEARVVMKHDSPLPLTNDIYRYVKKSFEITVPPGRVTQNFRIEIDPPKDRGQNVQATLKQL